MLAQAIARESDDRGAFSGGSPPRRAGRARTEILVQPVEGVRIRGIRRRRPRGTAPPVPGRFAQRPAAGRGRRRDPRPAAASRACSRSPGAGRRSPGPRACPRCDRPRSFLGQREQQRDLLIHQARLPELPRHLPYHAERKLAQPVGGAQVGRQQGIVPAADRLALLIEQKGCSRSRVIPARIAAAVDSPVSPTGVRAANATMLTAVLTFTRRRNTLACTVARRQVVDPALW